MWWRRPKPRWCGRSSRRIRRRGSVCGRSRGGSTRRRCPRANARAGIRRRSRSWCAIPRITVAPVLAKRRPGRASGSRDGGRSRAGDRRETRPITIARGASGWKFPCRRSSASRPSRWPRSGWCRTPTSRDGGRRSRRCCKACWCVSTVATACIGGGGTTGVGGSMATGIRTARSVRIVPCGRISWMGSSGARSCACSRIRRWCKPNSIAGSTRHGTRIPVASASRTSPASRSDSATASSGWSPPTNRSWSRSTSCARECRRSEPNSRFSPRSSRRWNSPPPTRRGICASATP